MINSVKSTKLNKTPPSNDHVNAFENDLYNMIQKIELHMINLFLNANTTKSYWNVSEDNYVVMSHR